MHAMQLRTLILLAIAACAAPLACSSGEEAPAPSSVEVGTVEVFARIRGGSEGLAFGFDASGKTVLYVGTRDLLLSVAPDGTVSEDDASVTIPHPLGMALQSDGSLLICGEAEGPQEGTALWRVSPAGERTMLVGPAQGTFGQFNFVAVASDDTIVVSDSGDDKVYMMSPDAGTIELVTDAITYPNGMAFSPDGSRLYVASHSTKRIFGLERTSNGFGPPEVAVEDVDSVDGIAVLQSGDLVLITSGGGILRWSLDGNKRVVAPATDFAVPANGSFGSGAYGEGWMYVTNLVGTTVNRVYVGEPGVVLPVR